METIQAAFQWGTVRGLYVFQGWKLVCPKCPHLDGMYMGQTQIEANRGLLEVNDRRRTLNLPQITAEYSYR